MTDQQKFLFEELNKWRSSAKEAIGGPYAGRLPNAKKPPEVVRAERESKRLSAVIAKWERKARHEHQAALNVIEKRYREARKKILFSGPKESLEFIDGLYKS